MDCGNIKDLSKFENLTKRERASIFRKAAVIVENQPKLAKYAYKDNDGCACLVGALWEAAEGVQLPIDAFVTAGGNVSYRTNTERLAPEAKAFVKEKTGREFAGLETYNNRPEVDNKVGAKALRTIARAIEHGGKFGV